MNKKTIGVVSLFLLILTFFIFFVTRFSSSSLIAQDGYFVSGNVIDKELMSDKKTVKKNNIKLLKMSSKDNIYQNLGRFFIGEEDKKKEVNVRYPIFTNNGLAIVNTNANNQLISKKFEFFDTYENFTITDGKLYNYGDYSQSDYEDYIFLQLENGSYVNLCDLSFPMSYRGKKIALNSIINFQENYVKYYYYDKSGKLVFDIIEGITLNDDILVGDKKYSYDDFLAFIGLRDKEEEILEEIEEEEEEYIIEDNSVKVSENETTGEVKYVKPKVKADDFTANVYSADSKLFISDPSGAITGGINFQLFIGDKLYSRKVFVSSGKIQIVGLIPNTTFKLVGSYRFYDEEHKKKESTFFEQTITTGDYKTLEPIELEFDTGSIYSDKIELNNFRISSSFDNEALKGLSKGIIVINGESYNFSSAMLKSLINGKTYNYESPTSLKSNMVQNFEVSFYDNFGNPLNVSKNKGSTRTSKAVPTSSFKVVKNEVNYTDIQISLKNSDNVNISNYRYVIFDNQNVIVADGKINSSLHEELFRLTDLDSNSTYYIKIMGDYDLLDGNGTINNVVMGEGRFTTLPLSSLGYVRVITDIRDVRDTSASLSTSLDYDNVSSILLQLLTAFEIDVKDENNNVIYRKIYRGEELSNFVSGESIINELTGLNSVTNYSISYTSTVTQGRTVEKITVVSGIKGFKTLKRNAYVDIQNRFVNNNMIDFDVRIVDADGAIEGDRVLLEVRDPFSKLIAMESLEINGSFVQLSYTKLDSNVNYSFKYYSEQYNIGYDNSTFENDYVLKDELINTENGISGTIELQEMTRQLTGDNLFNIRDYDRIRKEGNTGYKQYDLDNNAVRFGGKNGYVNFSYYLPEVAGKHVTVSFYAKYDSKSEYFADAYISNNYDNTLSHKLEGLTKEYKKYSFSFNLPSSYVGFLLNTPASKNERTDVWFKDIVITSDTDDFTLPVTLSYHSSGYRFTNTVMHSGNEYFNSFDEDASYLKGNPYDGYARITNQKTKEVFDFSYIGDVQTFMVPTTGDYRIELWGAAGGKNILDAGARASSTGGGGAYTAGDIHLEKNTPLYIFVGGKGSDAVPRTMTAGGWNGGGSADWDHSDDEADGGGGGATDVRLVLGDWNDTESLKSRIMVAGGGGGASDGIDGGAAGALSSFTVSTSIAATQISGYAFGYGQNGVYVRRNYPVAGGGGGYYGGYATDNGSNYKNPGSGGSSYISGYRGCVAYDKASSVPPRTIDGAYSEMDEYLASIKVRLTDLKHEISTNDYYIRIYLDGDEIASSPYRYDLVDHTVLDEIKQYSLKKNKKYTIKLSIKIRNRFYDIDSIYVVTNNEIWSIKTVDEFFNMHPNGKYVVVNDLDFSGINKYITNFYGELDCQGHSLNLNWNGRGYLFQYTRGGSNIKNVVLNVSLDNPTAKTWSSPFVLYHYGTIDNVQVNVLQSTDVSNYAVGILTYANYSIIKNFVIHTEVEVYAQSRFGLVTYSNQGLIKNGYIYGEDINAMKIANNVQKDVGALASQATTNSRIQNVFSLIGVKKDPSMASENATGNLIGYANVGKMENSFSVEKDDTSTNLSTQDPNYGRRSSMSAKNLFYASKKTYMAGLSNKISFLSLYDTSFLNSLLNNDKKFEINQYVELGYYPQLIMNDCMPNLDWIPLPSVSDEDLIDVTSVEEVSNSGDSAIVKLHINNPAGETIDSVGIQDIGKVRKISQENEMGKTVLTIEISEAMSYKSKYDLRVIKAINHLGKLYEISFNKGERSLDIDLYYPISTVNDWLRMNVEPTDNYFLTSDLDFAGVDESRIHISKDFSGILNGNGHVIKNISIPSKTGVFNKLVNNAIIKNLFIENYKKTSNTAYGGFVYTNSGTPTFDNVHMTNSSAKATTYLGSLIGYGAGNGVIIVNCSSTGFKSITNPDLSDVRIGGLVGYMAGNGYISNSFVQDVDIDIMDSIATYGIGGIVGQLANGSITNCYATGSIKSNSIYVGGIVGYSNAIISNCWSDVNIYSELDYVGGITGKRDHDTISSTLVVGPIYSNYVGGNINRTSGNSLLIPQKNYFWSEQPFYGYLTGDATAEKPLTSEQLKNVDTYHDLFDFGDDFDYSQVEEGILPKLNSISGELLPNQQDHKFESQKFNVRGVIQTTQRVEDGDVYFILDNPDNYEVTTVTFDYLKFEENNIRITNTGEGYTIVSISGVRPIRYYDFYTLTGVSYKTSSNATAQTVYKYIQVDLQFYKTLSSYTDWRSISTSTTENYRLTGDLDFSGVANINTNVSIGRLEGQGAGYAIKNITINDIKTTFSLIRKITSSLKNVRFENITFNIKDGSSYNSYCNIIRLNLANIENVEFNNITINAPGVTNYVGPIAINRGQSLRNITIKNSRFIGKNYVSGLIGNSQALDAYMINADNVTVYGDGSYVGAVLGNRGYSASTRWFYVTGNNLNVTGRNYTGGLYGVGGANYSTITHSTVHGLAGAERVGGIAGSNADRYAYYYEADDIDVITDDAVTYTGGLFGWAYDAYYCYIRNSRITSYGTSAVYTGGIQGYKSGYANYYNGVVDTVITSSGTGGTGGLVGYSSGSGTNCYSYVTKTEINGVSNVGGGIGNGRNSRFYYSTINVKINASGFNVGGVYGYINNVDAADSTYSDVVHEIVLENSEIVGSDNVALFAGYATGNVLFDKFFYNVYLVGTVTTTGSRYGIVLPQNSVSSLELSSILPRFYVYDQCILNGDKIGDIAFLNDAISNLTLITANNLATQSYYASHGITTSYFTFTDYNGSNLINNGYYPFVKTATGQIPIKLPTSTVSFNTFGLSLRSINDVYHELPTLDVYSSGINTINFELSDLDSSVKMEIYENQKLVFDNYLTHRVYSFYYDYSSSIKIVLSDGKNKKVYSYGAEDLVNTVTTFKNTYAYIYDGKLKGNIKTTSDQYIHIYGKYALTESYDIYDLEKGEFKSRSNNYSLTDTGKIISLFEFDIGEAKVDTYYKYSVIHKKDQDIYYDGQLFYQNGSLEIIDASLENVKNTVIIDKSGNKNFVTVLGTNGIIYNLKDEIQLPSRFTNANIKYMTHNINNNSNMVVVMYDTGRVVVFDYRTGTEKVVEKATEKISVFEYIKSSSVFQKSIIDDNVIQSYDESIELQNKLEEKPIYTDGDGNYFSGDTDNEKKSTNNSINSSYVTYYNAVKNSYDVVDMGSIISGDKKEIVTENDKIYTSNYLMRFYMKESTYHKVKNNINVVYLLLIVLFSVFVALILWFKNAKDLKVKGER